MLILNPRGAIVGIIKKILSSNREMDYNMVNDKNKEISFLLKRGAIFHQAVDRAKWYLAPKFFHVVDFPTHLEVETSFACQMRCPMCTRRKMPKDLTYGTMDFELYKKIIDEAASRGVYSVKLSWRGEPLLNPNIVKMVKYAKDKGIKDVAFLSNGERLNEKIAMQLVDAGLDWISFSVDGMGETYDRIRWPSTWETIVKKIRFLKEYRDSKGLKKPLIRVQSIWGAVKDNYEEYFSFWDKIADKVYIIADQKRMNEGVNFERDPNYVCYEPWRRLCIGWNGIVPQCISDYEEYVILGDVRKQSIYEVWHGKEINKLRETIKNKRIFSNKMTCNLCHDPGIMYTKSIKVGKRTVKIGLYRGQELDVATMDSRPKSPDKLKE